MGDLFEWGKLSGKIFVDIGGKQHLDFKTGISEQLRKLVSVVLAIVPPVRAVPE